MRKCHHDGREDNDKEYILEEEYKPGKKALIICFSGSSEHGTFRIVLPSSRRMINFFFSQLLSPGYPTVFFLVAARVDQNLPNTLTGKESARQGQLCVGERGLHIQQGERGRCPLHTAQF